MFLLGFACGVAATAVVAYYLRAAHRTHAATPPTPVDVLEPVDTHGHPFDVVGELAQRLPHVDRHLWEYGIRFNPAGEPLLFLNLLDLGTVQVIASTSANLRWRTPFDGRIRFPWSTDYAEFGAEFTADWARREIVLPLLDWAKAEANKHGGDEVEQYGIQS